MDLGNFAANTLNGALGNIQKGIIEIFDMRAADEGYRDVQSAVGALGGLTTASLAGSFAPNSAFPQLTSALDGVSTLTGANMLESMKKYMTGIGAAGFTRKQFEVQFNPSEIRMSGYGGGMFSRQEYGQDKGENKLVFEAMKPRITLDLSLIFDEADPQETFMAEPFSLAPSSLVKTAGKGIQKLTGLGKPVTVQDKAEAFTAALRDPGTRFVTFHWGNMSYSGLLIHVSVRYSMFDTTGVPVRATVGLSIVCYDDGANDLDTAEWDAFYQAAFKKSDSFGGKAASIGNKVGNLLNINL